MSDLRQRIDALEKSYEFFLAYAAQGLTRTTAASKDGEARRHLEVGIRALDGLADLFRREARTRKSPESYLRFVDTLERDAATSAAAFAMVLEQAAISSQLIDNLNASVHVRALLTDLFVLDEALDLPTEDDPES